MIQPIKSGRALLDEMETLQLPAERIALWWLGQSGFAIKWRGAILFLDPYLSEHLTAKYANTERPHIRMTAAPFRGSDVRRADLVLATHKHSDHLDPGTVPDILRNCPNARLVAPRALLDHAAGMGMDRTRLLGAEAGRQIRFPVPSATAAAQSEIIIHPVPAAHEKLDYTDENGYPYLGYVLELGGRAIYHSGDCIPYDGLLDRLRPFRPDAMLLPINGRDPRRGVPGNFTVAEAAELARAAGAAWLVPMHYDMFTFNTVDVAGFVAHMQDHHPEQNYRVLRCGELWEL